MQKGKCDWVELEVGVGDIWFVSVLQQNLWL